MKIKILFFLMGIVSVAFGQNSISVVSDSSYTSQYRSDLKGSQILYQCNMLAATSYDRIGDSLIVKVTTVTGQNIVDKFVCYYNAETAKSHYSLISNRNATPNVLLSVKSPSLFEVIISSAFPEKYCSVNFQVYSKSQNIRITASETQLTGCK